MQANSFRSALALLFAPAARAAAWKVTPPPDADERIRLALMKRFEGATCWDAETSNVFVDHGTVIFQGLAGNEQARRAAREAAMALEGVRSVWDARVPRREWQAMA